MEVGALYKNLGRVRIWGHAHRVHTPKCGAGLRRWENQRRLSSYDLVIYAKVRATKVKAKANVED